MAIENVNGQYNDLYFGKLTSRGGKGYTPANINGGNQNVLIGTHQAQGINPLGNDTKVATGVDRSSRSVFANIDELESRRKELESIFSNSDSSINIASNGISGVFDNCLTEGNDGELHPKDERTLAWC